MNIAGVDIGPGQPVRLIAEFGSNHGGSLDKARRLIDTAAEAGADFVKGQYISSPDIMVERDHPDYKAYGDVVVPMPWLSILGRHAEDAGIPLFWSVFDVADVKVLEDAGVPTYKIASAELTYVPLLEAVAATDKPTLVSTGMARQGDVDKARHCFAWDQVLFLHCVSAYPAPPEDMNLWHVFEDWREIYGYDFGLSDHTADPFAAPLMAAALGACIIEKHYRLVDSTGPDADFAIFPAELAALATALHNAHLLLSGDGVKRVMPSEEASLSDRRTVHADGRWLRG